MRRPAIVLAVMTLALLAAFPPVGAATTHVVCPPDDLQAALDAAAPGDVLVIHGTCEGAFVVEQDLTLRGKPGATLRGDGGTDSVLLIDFGVTATVKRLRITGGMGVGLGGGIDIRGSATLVVAFSTVAGNSTDSFGGGINNQGTLRLRRSTVSGNEADQGGGIANDGTLTVQTSTVSGNEATNGAGVANIFGDVLLRNATIAGNMATGEGGGIWGPGYTLGNTLVGDNAAPVGPDCSAATSSEGHNLVEDPTGCAGLVASDITGQDPRLRPLRRNGGPTRTHALRPKSPARHEAAPSLSTNRDQRGVLRTSDVGAYEFVRCRGVIVNLVGTNGSDVLIGGPGRDGALGYGDDDFITTKEGRDGICGGQGQDVIDAGSGHDRVQGGRGHDWIHGRDGRDVLRGWRGADTIFGGMGADELWGDGGSDSLRGQKGPDSLFGGAGPDDCDQGPGSGPMIGCSP